MIGNTTKMDRNGHRSNTRRQASWVESTTKRTGMDIGHPPVFKASGRKPNENNELSNRTCTITNELRQFKNSKKV